jgi:hypothetical protein
MEEFLVQKMESESYLDDCFSILEWASLRQIHYCLQKEARKKKLKVFDCHNKLFVASKYFFFRLFSTTVVCRASHNGDFGDFTRNLIGEKRPIEAVN